jgi:hypothetical protein
MKVAHHPWPELLGGEGQRQDRCREDNADDGDNGCRDGNQYLAAGVCAAGTQPEREGQVVVVRGEINGKGDGEENERHDDQNAGNQPECRSECFSAPTWELATPRPDRRGEMGLELGQARVGHGVSK